MFLSPAALEAQQTEKAKVAELQTALEESQARAAQLEKAIATLGERARQRIHHLETGNKVASPVVFGAPAPATDHSKVAELQMALKESRVKAAQLDREVTTLQKTAKAFKDAARAQEKMINRLETDNKALTELAASPVVVGAD